jgi:hypothetical protein
MGGRRWFVAAAMAALVSATAASVSLAAQPAPTGGSELADTTEVDIAVLNSYGWVDDQGLHVVGEVRNTSAYRIDGFVTIEVTPGDNGASSQVLTGPAVVTNLAPGARSAYVVSEPAWDPPSTTVTSITAGGFIRPNPSGAIGVSAVSAVTSDPALNTGTGDSVRVQVRNTTARPVHLFSAVAGFRGSNGKISNVGLTGTTDVTLAPGEVWEDWASAAPSGKLAVSADVDVQARFADGANEAVVSWQNWFRDIDASSLRLSIAWLAEQGITTGCAPYRFCPTANVTRAQMAMFLDRAFDLPSAATDYFDDDDGKTGEASINALAKAGITGGCGPRRFCPTANVTRAQMAMFLDRAIEPPLPSTSTDYFDDDDGRTGEAATNRIAAAGITGGCGPRRFCPTAFVTRAQMAAFLKRALD